MNLTADLVAQTLFGVEMLRDKICRVYSVSREDIFNVNIRELPEWSIIHKMLYDKKRIGSFTTAHISFVHSLIDRLPHETVALAAKFHIETYFGNVNYRKDEFLKKSQN